LPGRQPYVSPQGTAARVIAPQRIAGRRHRGGVAGGDVARGHGRDQRAAGGVDHPPGAGGARPARSRPGPAGRHPGRAAGRGARQAARGAVPGPRGRTAAAPATRDPAAGRRGVGRRRACRRGRGRPAPPGTAAAGRGPHASGRAARRPRTLTQAAGDQAVAPARPASAPTAGPARAQLATAVLAAAERPQAAAGQTAPGALRLSSRQAPAGGPRRRADLPRGAPRR
jgi:hypothetical protein